MSDTQDNAVTAFAGRVMLAFAALLVLGAMAAAMVGLAYWSKYRSETAPHGASSSNAAVVAPRTYPNPP